MASTCISSVPNNHQYNFEASFLVYIVQLYDQDFRTITLKVIAEAPTVFTCGAVNIEAQSNPGFWSYFQTFGPNQVDVKELNVSYHSMDIW